MSLEPILPGSMVMWQSVQTGKWCRVVQDAGLDKVLCDMDSSADATPMEYTGAGRLMRWLSC